MKKVGCLKLIIKFVIIMFLFTILYELFGVNGKLALVIAVIIFQIVDSIIAKISGHSFFY